MKFRALLARSFPRTSTKLKAPRGVRNSDTSQTSTSDGTYSYYTIGTGSETDELPDSLQRPLHYQSDTAAPTMLNTTAARRASAPFGSHETPAQEIARLRAINFDLAQQLEKAEQDLERRNASMAEMEVDLVRLFEKSKKQEAKQEKLEAENERLQEEVGAENERLRAQVKRLSTSKWTPWRGLKKRLVEAAETLKVAENQIAGMKYIIKDLTRERNDLRNNLDKAVSELHDLQMRSVGRRGSRTDSGMHRHSSVHSSFGGGFI
ncbi:hypothetical protein CB0940_08646 [Cercospora beticola]|uniref:Uncharacterized protein n=1 Tax=Cercospora beticola TaxID=122368 RepID=A0A2G5HQ30_CERBT|nr:hypothetical protein CB0940_08646 [Cercospora beticola]PIA94630.1 hypothetical protein CB0940_08646 [Cercospora beticola]WPB05227.1 hypothetical protein RHO25_009878 [Cercospora beticola]CAK1365016.1 unnamed protein product [Cercospora beticola]